MQLKSQEFLSQLRRGEVPPLICLYGEELFFRDRAVRQLIDSVVPEEARDFNLTVVQGREVSGRMLGEEVQTFPVFADRRLVIVKDAHNVPAAELDALTGIFANPTPEAVVVFVADKIDKRKKFFQLLQKQGLLVEFKPLYDNQVPAFVRELLAEQGLRMTEAAMSAFCRRTGANLQDIASELDKLRSYLGENQLIDVAEVEQVVSKSRHQSVFDLTDSLGMKDARQGVRTLRELLADGESPVGVLSMLVRHFRQLWKIAELLEGGAGRRDIPRMAGVNPYFVDGLIRQSRNFTPGQLRRFHRLFVDADLALKSSGAHPAAILESLVLEISGR